MRKLKRFMVKGNKNSLRYLYNYVSPLRVIFNFIIIYACRFLPSFSAKNFLYRLIGIKVEKNVSVGLMAMMDIIFPEEICIGENSIIGYNSVLLGHEFLVNEWHRGKIQIGKNVMIGANTTVLPGVTIGDNSIVSACSLVNKNIPSGVLAGGVPVKIIKRLGEDDEN